MGTEQRNLWVLGLHGWIHRRSVRVRQIGTWPCQWFFHSIRSEPDGNRGDFAMPNSEGKQHHRPYAGTPRIVCTALWLRVCGKTLHVRCVCKSYTGGVMSSAACGPMGAAYQDHCVMAVGFNTTASTPYWIVRNSWATTWGEQGYIYLEMAENTCGLADDATIPTVKVDLTEEEAADAAVRREAMYQMATQGAVGEAVKVMV